jgi:hypothetical protein
MVRFWGTYWSYSEDHLLGFSAPTHTHVSDTHNHGYGHFGTTTCGVSGLLENQFHEWVEAFGTVINSGEIKTFKLVLSLVD